MIGYLLLLCVTNVIYVMSYDYNMSKFCANLASISYCDHEKEIINRFSNSDINIDTILYNEDYDTNGYVGHDNETIYVVLRGSTSKQDWKNNFNIRLINYYICENCYVHEGFYNYAMSVEKQVSNVLNKYKKHNVIFTGHSLGSSVMLLSNIERNVTIITFGSPRIGNEEFAKYMSERHKGRFYRHTHYKDIVPHIPTFRFTHVKDEIYEDEYGNIQICDGYEDEKCSMQHLLKDTNVDDHMWYLSLYMGCYIPFTFPFP